jgi:hypothetical protein
MVTWFLKSAVLPQEEVCYEKSIDELCCRLDFVLTDGDQKVVNVDNPDVLKGHEGHHVAVTGAMTGDTIHISSVKML